MARDPSGEMRTGWVYRSDAAAAFVEPAAGASSPAAGHAVPVRVEQRSASSTAPPRRQRGWIESGIHLMVLPITITMDLMFAPVTWFFGSRR